MSSSPPSPPRKHEGGLGFRRLLYDLRHRRRKHRQAMGVALIMVLTILGDPYPPMWAIGTAVAGLGMLIRLWASGLVVKNELLATNGPYGFVRHPLYVGNILMGIGFCLASQGEWLDPVWEPWWRWAALALLLWYFYPQTIRYEDRKLHKYFGEDWEKWSSVTRALIPRLRPYGTGGGEAATWSLRLSAGRNGELWHILIGIVCLTWLHYLMG